MMKTDPDLTIVKGQPTSAEVRAKLKAEGKPVLLAFSTGKDSVAAWIALKNEGIEVVPAYLYCIPDLKFVDEEIARYEDHFQTRVHQYPHPMLWQWLSRHVHQPPERIPTLVAANLQEPSPVETWDMIAESLGMADSWRADGIRAADSIVRRASLTRHGVMKPSNMKVSPIHDWKKAKVLRAIEEDGAPLSRDYEVFGRSFDGADYRFTKPMKEHYPEDFATMKRWLPLLEADHMRTEVSK
jgi:3'-phosphoadenosine 5'-phosphosulfate sulfotransferase (PAPS reductase)/FAD synthetase